MIDWKLKDRVMVAFGPHAGRVGTVTAIDKTGYGVHLDHFGDQLCQQDWFYPIQVVRVCRHCEQPLGAKHDT
jgi:hypothetical protein